MKIISFDNIIYKIDIEENDNLLKVKQKLSEKINTRPNDIGLVYKNRILFDDTLIKDYQIDPDDFVLVCIIENNGNKFSEEASRDLTDSSCIIPTNDEYKLLDMFSPITISVKSITCTNMYIIKTKPNEIIFDALKRYLPNLRYLCFTHNESFIDTTRSFYDCNLNDGDVILMENLLETKREYFHEITLEPINKNYESISLFVTPQSTIDYIKLKLSKEISIPLKNIQLFKDENQLESCEISEHICVEKKLFYNIFPDFENIIKQDLIDRGSFGSVYKCIQLNSRKEFALKELRFCDRSCSEINLFHKEIAILCSLGDHPRIVKFEQYFREETCLYILMEYVPGGSLGSHIRNHGRLTEKEIIRFSQEILEAIQYLHYLHIIHRDVKGDNVLLDYEQHVKLCDFSLSKILIHAASKGGLNGTAKSFVGTANWMAPEIINGKEYDRAADIWSFGATVIEMFTGKPPYSELGYYAVIFRIGFEKKILYEVPRDFNKEFQKFLDSCLHSNPSKRLSAEALLEHPFLKYE